MAAAFSTDIEALSEKMTDLAIRMNTAKEDFDKREAALNAREDKLNAREAELDAREAELNISLLQDYKGQRQTINRAATSLDRGVVPTLKALAQVKAAASPRQAVFAQSPKKDSLLSRRRKIVQAYSVFEAKMVQEEPVEYLDDEATFDEVAQILVRIAINKKYQKNGVDFEVCVSAAAPTQEDSDDVDDEED